MKARALPVSLAIGLGLVLALLWAFGSDAVWATTAPRLTSASSPSALAPGNVITVCTSGGCDYVSVQAAVDAANPGDIIKVAAGTYTGVSVRAGVAQVVYINKSVTIRGGYLAPGFSEPPDPNLNPTTLDAGGGGRVVYITGNVAPTLEGLRITGGDATGLGGGPPGADAGGGVYVISATAAISNNQVFGNIAGGATSWGGGVYLLQSVTTLDGNSIFSNTAGYSGGGIQLVLSVATVRANAILSNTSAYGGGMDVWDSGNVAISGNTIRANTVITSGGGLYVSESAIVLSGNAILSNTAAYGGGGLFVILSRATLSGNTVAFNVTPFGGGVFLAGSNSTVSGNNIFSNIATSQGGGLILDSSAATLSGNIIRGNTAVDGGGLYLYRSGATLINNVVIENQITGGGGGLTIWDDSSQLLHTTIHDNSGGNGSGIDAGGGSTITLTNTILVSQTVGITVATGSAATLNGVLWYGNGADTGGSGSIAVTNDVTGAPRFAADGYHLTADSAAPNTGVASGVGTDIDGQSRYRNLPDLGADELGVERTFDPAAGGTLAYVDAQGLTTTVEVAPTAVTRTVILAYTPVIAPGYPLSPGMQFADHAFDLDASCIERIYLPLIMRNSSLGTMVTGADGAGWRGPLTGGAVLLDPHSVTATSGFAYCSLSFLEPVTITIHYSDADVAGIDENALRLYYWTGTQWEDAANTCTPPSSYSRDLTGNVLSVPICHLSRFSMQG